MHTPDGGAIQEVWVINLAKCTDRLQRMTRRLMDAGINFNRFNARTPNDPLLIGCKFGNPGQMACSLSHYLIWRDCYNRGLNRVLILEDDVIFRTNWTDILVKQIKELDELSKTSGREWQMLHINPDPLFWNKPDDYGTKDYDRANKPILLAAQKNPTHSTGGYVINRSGLKFLLDTFPTPPQLLVADFMTIKLQYCDKSYTYYPYLGFQEEYESFVTTQGGLITKKQISDYIRYHHELYDNEDMLEFNRRYEEAHGELCWTL